MQYTFISINHWTDLYVNHNNVTYFDSFGFEYIPKEIKKYNLILNIYRIQEDDSIISGYFRIGFIDFMLIGKSLLDYTYLVSSNDMKTMIK